MVLDSYSAGWPAPAATAPLDARLVIPGSKSLTNRELVLSALADSPSTLRAPLIARDTRLMADALSSLGATIDTADPEVWRITPGPLHGGVDIHAGLAGTVMRFLPPVAALAAGDVTIDGDEHARKRPMATTIDALRTLGVAVDDDARGGLPFTIHGDGMVEGGELTIDASASSQFVSGLLLAAPRFRDGLVLHHSGERLPSLPHIEMTVEVLRARNVRVSTPEPTTWVVEPGPIAGVDRAIEPDLSNAGPFLAAALLAGGRVTIAGWPDATTQVGDLFRTLLPRFGATVTRDADGLTVDGGAGYLDGARWPGVDLDLTEGGELAPTFAALAALATTPSTITGIGHLRGHETDRLAALAAEIGALGGRVTELPDGLAFEPAELRGGPWHAYADHRMAHTGALLGLVVPGVVVDDIASTTKTLADFPGMWEHTLTSTGSVPRR
jgi:3-phosphoshikimate 1-carboxyvinyltransferase